jgi:hypothetical protein
MFILRIVAILFVLTGTAMSEDIDPRTQCEKVMKGATKSDRSYQPIYRPCCTDPGAMASKEAMERFIGEQALKEMQKRGINPRSN